MIELQTVTTKAKNPSTNEFQDVTWGGINVLSTSGTTNYNNLTNKPTINGVTVQGSLTTGDLLITAVDVGALPSGTKYGADFALSIDSQTFVVTAQLKDQDGNNLGQAKTIDLPLETMVVSGSYDDTTQKIILTLKNGQTVEFSVADLVSGLQSEITLSNKLDADLVSDVSSENKFVTASEKATWNAKQDALTFDGTYDASTNKAATVSTVTDAINSLDVSSVGGSGKYISAISETNGKISATVETMDTVPTSGSTKAVTSGGVQAPLAEVVDNGAKNCATVNNATYTNVNRWFNIDSICDKNCVLSLDSITSTDTNASTCALLFEFEDDTLPSKPIQLPRGTRYEREFSLAKNVKGLHIYASDTYNHSGTTNTVTITNLMLCTKAAWDISHKFVPYALPNPTLTPALIEQVDNGAKNHLYCDVSVMKSVNTNGTWSGNAFTHNSGVTFTINSDSSITVNGTASDVNGVFVLSTDFTISQGDWILSGTPIGGSTSTYNIAIAGVISDVGNAARFSSATNKLVRIYVLAGTTVNNLLFKPMICSADDWAISQAYVPYGKTNPELTTLSEEDRAALVEVVDAGAKNLLQLFQLGSSNANVGNPCTSQGVEYEIQSDGTITAYRKSSSSSGAYIFLYKNGEIQNVSELFDGNHIWSGNPPQYPDGGVSVWYKIGSGSNITLPNGALLPNANGEDVRIGFQIQTSLSPTQSNPIVFKPMICTKAEWDISQAYVPYGKTNTDLTVENASQQSEINYAVNTGVKNLLSVNDGSGTNVQILSQSGIIKSGNYVMSFKASDFSGNYSLSFFDANGALINHGSLNGAITADKSVSFTLGQDAYTVKFIIRGTATISELMLRPAEIADPTFQPYALPNPTLTPAAIKAVDEGAKNIQPVELEIIKQSTTAGSWSGNVYTESGSTYTINDDGTITVDTTGLTAQSNLFLSPYLDINNGKWVVSGCPQGGTSETYYIATNSTSWGNPREYGNGVELDISNNKIRLAISVKARSGILVFRPMICTAADWAVSQKFVPYCPSLYELYQMIQALQNNP